MMPDGTANSSSSSKETAEASDNDNDMGPAPEECESCGESLPGNALFCPTCGSPVAQAESIEPPADTQIAPAPIENKEAPVADEIQTPTAEAANSPEPVVTPVVEAAPAAPATITLSNDQFQALLGAVSKTAEAAPAEPVVEEVPVSMTKAEVDAMIASAKEEARVEAQTEAVEAIRAAGIIPRQGLVGAERLGMAGAQGVATTVAPTLKELSEMSEDDFWDNTAEALNSHPGWRRISARADAAAGLY